MNVDRRFLRRTGLLALVVGLASARFAAPSAAQGTGAEALRPGDTVHIEVWQKPELSGDFRVGADSALVHPLYRDVKVAGVPVRVAESRILAFLTSYEGPSRLSFQPLFQVFVGGEVLQPGVRGVPSGTTIAEAIAGAGGVTRQARAEAVTLTRDGASLRIDLRNPADPTLAAPVHSGDQIFVPSRSDFVGTYLIPISSLTTVVLAVLSFIIK
jgi:protein involved in polysaccharide export with SLBB domain